MGSPVLPQSLSYSFLGYLGQLRVPHTHPLLLCSVMSPRHRALRETRGHSAGASVRGALLPCPVCCLLGPWIWKMFMVSREALASLGLCMAYSKGSANPPCQRRLFRFYIPISLGKASILKTCFPQELIPVLVQTSSGKLMTKDLLALMTFSSPCGLLWVEYWIFWTNLLMWYEGLKFGFFCMRVTYCSILLIENTVLSVLSCLCTFVKDHLSVMWVLFLNSVLPPWSHVLQTPRCHDQCNLIVSLEMGSSSSLTLWFFFKVV